jgi:hypothetical protein
MVDYSKTYRIIFDDCIDYSRNVEYQQAIQFAGARVQDFVIDFRTKRIKYYIVLGVSFDTFLERINSTSYGCRIFGYWNSTRGVSEL